MKIKDYFNQEYAIFLANKIQAVYPNFKSKEWIEMVKDKISDQEYSEKMILFVEIFDQVLPEYQQTLKIFEKILGNELSSFSKMYEEGMWLAPIGKYVECHCTENDYDLSIQFIEQLTKRYTGEFAMRPLIVKYPQKSLETIEKWSQSNNDYVRRLSSECIRISLPWAKKMTVAVEHFEQYKRILGHLKNDSNTYVCRSVANNLNDLYKYDKNLFFNIIKEWQQDQMSENTKWIIQYGSRTYQKEQRKKQG